MASELSIALVGPGAIGTTVAAALHEKGRTPILCGRTPMLNYDYAMKAVR